jgi:serine/threonine protein phosphatase PrpC
MGSAPIFVGVGNALGRREPLVYKQDHIELQAGDRIVLATDGLSENVAPEELAALIDTAPSPEQAVAALQEMMCDKQRRDRGRSDDPSGFRHDDATAIIRYIGLTPS